MKRFLFKHRDGQTPLPPEFQRDLIPKNIQLCAELDEHEEQNIALGLSWLEKQTADGTDFLFWKKLHKHLFDKVWKWAGLFRKIELQNEEFHPVKKIQTEVKQLTDDVIYWIESKELQPKEIAARFHERLLTIHPFINGNGRLARILTAYLCQQHNFPIPTWNQGVEDQKQRRDLYIRAVQAARKDANYQRLIEFMFS